MRLAGIVLLLLAMAATDAEAQLRGRVIDLRTGDAVADASVRVVAAQADLEMLTDTGGAYAFTALNPAEYWLFVRHPGYADVNLRVVLRPGSDVTIDVPLELRPIPVQPLVIPVSRDWTRIATATKQDSLLARIESRENGALRTAATAALQDLVQAEPQESGDPAGGTQPSSLHIWGSGADRGRVLIDGAAIAAPLHLGAVLPPIDGELLSHAVLRTGGASARYDGGTTYILEYVTRPAADRLRSWGELGLLTSRAGVEVPVNDDASVMVGARRVNDEAVAALTDRTFDYAYDDVLARGAWRLTPESSVRATALATRETIRLPRDQGVDDASWRNVAAALSWGVDPGRDGMRLEASVSRGTVDLPLLTAPEGHMKATLDRAAMTASGDWSADDVDFDAGFQLEHHRLARASRAREDPAFPDLDGPVTCTPSLPCASATSTTVAVFGDAAWQPRSRLAVRAGLRAALDVVESDPYLLPRLAVTWMAGEATSATLSAGRYSQIEVLEPPLDVQSTSRRLQTRNARATQVELRLAHRAALLAVEAAAFVRRSRGWLHTEATTTPGAELSWAMVAGRSSVSGSYSLLARRASPWSSVTDYQHLLFMGAGTGAGPLHLDISGVYGAGIPLTSIVLDRPPPVEFYDPPDAPAADGTSPYVRIDAVLAGDWSLRTRNRRVHVTPYVKIVNAFSRHGALFYFRNRGGADLQPLSALPTMPVIGVRWSF